MTRSRLLIFVPTYNENHNVERLCAELRALSLDADILFIDDGSPDGTGATLDRLAREHSRIAVIHREGKLGIGSAHRAGITYAYAKRYDLLITLDAACQSGGIAGNTRGSPGVRRTAPAETTRSASPPGP